MTRDEAIEKAADVSGLIDLGARGCWISKIAATNFVLMAEQLGMLKLEEPKSCVDRFCDKYHGHGCTESMGPIISKALAAAGLKIVEK